MSTSAPDRIPKRSGTAPRSGTQLSSLAGASPLARQVLVVRNQVKSKLSEFGLRNVRVFGSVATGRDDAQSDVDLLVTATQPIGLLALASAEMEVAEIIGADVDLVLDRSIRPDLRERITSEAVPL